MKDTGPTLPHGSYTDRKRRAEEYIQAGIYPEAQREARSPVGPAYLCDPCDHLWSEHDDEGCLWVLCRCGLPGERK